MKDFMPRKNQEKKMLENVLAVSAKARREKEKNKEVIFKDKTKIKINDIYEINGELDIEY